MEYTLKDVTVVICNWMQTRFTLGAVRNIRKYYPDIKVIIVDDGSADPDQKESFNKAYARDAYFKEGRYDNDLNALVDGAIELNARLKFVGTHVGHGSAIDYGLDCVETPLMLTMDNDIRLREGGLIEEYLEKLNEDTYNICSIGTTFTESNPKSKWISMCFSIFQKSPIKRLHLTFSNFLYPVEGGPNFHIGTGAFLHTMLTFDTLHRPKVWKAIHYPEPEEVPQLCHLRRFTRDTEKDQRVIDWNKYIDG